MAKSLNKTRHQNVTEKVIKKILIRKKITLNKTNNNVQSLTISQ